MIVIWGHVTNRNTIWRFEVDKWTATRAEYPGIRCIITAAGRVKQCKVYPFWMKTICFTAMIQKKYEQQNLAKSTSENHVSHRQKSWLERDWLFGLRCFRGCESLNKKPIDATKNGELPRYKLLSVDLIWGHFLWYVAERDKFLSVSLNMPFPVSKFHLLCHHSNTDCMNSSTFYVNHTRFDLHWGK